MVSIISQTACVVGGCVLVVNSPAAIICGGHQTTPADHTQPSPESSSMSQIDGDDITKYALKVLKVPIMS